jgi:ABC-2 type transport system ATP-binding protein
MLDHLAHLKGMIDKNERRRLVDDMLRQVNLFDVAAKSLGGYSGGMRQRFGIA